MTDELDPVHAGQVEVDDDDVHRTVPGTQLVQRGVAVGGLEQIIQAEVGQQAQRHATLEPVVLDDHHAQTLQRHRHLLIDHPGPWGRGVDAVEAV